MNEKFFSGNLPTPRFVVNQSNEYLGQCSYSCKRNMFGRRVGPMHYAICISNYYSRPEGNILNTLLHEMIHLYFYSIGKMNVGHGPEFQEMGRSFDRYGFNIKTCSDVSSNIHPRIYQCSEYSSTSDISNQWILLLLVLFVVWAFASNPDAMKVLVFVSRIALENMLDFCQRMVESIVNRTLGCLFPV